MFNIIVVLIYTRCIGLTIYAVWAALQLRPIVGHSLHHCGTDRGTCFSITFEFTCGIYIELEHLFLILLFMFLKPNILLQRIFEHLLNPNILLFIIRRHFSQQHFLLQQHFLQHGSNNHDTN